MLAIGSDHGGYELRQEVMKWLDEQGIAYKDFGCATPASIDYADIAEPVAQAIVSGECERGILICGTGIGISIAANKVKGIRAAACSDFFSAEYTRRHNDANILAFGGRVVGPGLAIKMVESWLNAEFEGGRHQKRIDKIAAIEARQ